MDEWEDVDGDVFMDEMGDVDGDAFVVQWGHDEGFMDELRLTLHEQEREFRGERVHQKLWKWDTDSLVQEMQNQNPAITGVSVRGVQRESTTNLDAVGTYIGNSKHLKHLYLRLPHLLTSANVDAMSFCRHIAINQSIESLSIRCDGGDDEDEAFHNLLALFEGNSSILEVNLQCQIPATAIVCLDRCQSVRALRLFDITLGDIAQYESFFEMLSRKSGQLHHLTVCHVELNQTAMQQINRLLCAQNCTLKSLTLEGVSIQGSSNVSLLINGLLSSSIKCFRCPGITRSAPLLLQAFSSERRLSAIEKLDFSSCSLDGLTLASILQNTTTLRSLDLRVLNLNNRSHWDNIFRATLGPLSSLEELIICACSFTDETVHALATCMNTNTSLKLLDFSGNIRVSDDALSALFVSFHNTRLEEIGLSAVIRSNAALLELANFVRASQFIRVIDMPFWSLPADTPVWVAFAAAIEGHPALEEIDMSGPPREIASIQVLLRAFRASPVLKKVSLPIRGIDNLRDLEIHNWSLEKCEINYAPERRHESVNEVAPLNEVIVNILQRNSTLKVLKFRNVVDRFVVDWALISTALCNTSSIDEAVSASNHSIQFLDFFGLKAPLDIDAMLCSNKNTDKLVAAMEKIIRSGMLNEVEFVPSSLPHVFSRIGMVKSSAALSQLYKMVREVPHEIEYMPQRECKKRRSC